MPENDDRVGLHHGLAVLGEPEELDAEDLEALGETEDEVALFDLLLQLQGRVGDVTELVVPLKERIALAEARLEKLATAFVKLKRLVMAQATPQSAALLTPDQAASMLGVSRRTLYRYLDDNVLGSIRVGSHLRRIPGEEIQRMLKKEK